MSARMSRRMLLIGALAGFVLFTVWMVLPLVLEDRPHFVRWGLLGTPASVFGAEGAGDYAASVGLFFGLLLLTQWIFLRPVRRTAVHSAEAGKPRWAVGASLAFVATLLCTGVVATVLEMPDWWTGMVGMERDEQGSWAPVWIAMGLVWLVWAAAFFVYFRQGDFLSRAESAVRLLIRGSLLELLVAIPTHALVYRRSTDDCYCARGSYTGLVFGSAVLLWAFGPGLLLLFLREKKRRMPILQQLCPQCGAPFDRSAPPGTPCPQCGRVGAVR